MAQVDEVRVSALLRRIEALEALRPVWAQGYTSDSVAAQTSAVALSQLWRELGVDNQTSAMEALRSLKEKATPAKEG